MAELLGHSFSLGVGFTNACNLTCSHCYRSEVPAALKLDDVLRAVEAVPTRAVNLGTGESALHPDYSKLVAELTRRQIPLTMTTNGHSARELPDEQLSVFQDIEFSVDDPQPSRP